MKKSAKQHSAPHCYIFCKNSQSEESKKSAEGRSLFSLTAGRMAKIDDAVSKSMIGFTCRAVAGAAS